MKKIERVCRELLLGALARRERFTQRQLAQTCGVAIGLVNRLIARLAVATAVSRTAMGFRLLDPSKVLFDWAAARNIRKDITASYRIDRSVSELERSLPGAVIFTAYSGWRLLAKGVPFDYREVYIYLPAGKQKLFELWLKENRPKGGPPNLFVMMTDDQHLIANSKRSIAPLPQIFVDIYSLGGLAAKYFIKDILDKHPEWAPGG